MPVTNVQSRWASGNLIYHESGNLGDTVNLFTIGTSDVTVGNASNDVDFRYYGSGSVSAVIDCGAATITLAGLTATTNKPLTITDATATSSTTTGALIVTGGIATAADLNVGDDIFLASGAVLNFAASDVTLTHSSNLLTMAGGGLTMGASGTPAGDLILWGTTANYKVSFDVDGDTNGRWNFGDDDYGVDVVFAGQTASAAVTWDSSADDLIWTGAARAILGTSGTPLALTAGSPLLSVYSTCAGVSGSTNAEPVVFNSVMTGAGQVGGRVFVNMSTNVVLGGWANALKVQVQNNTNGGTNGLESVACLEMVFPASDGDGTYTILELEANCPTGWVGTAANYPSYINFNQSGNTVANWDTVGNLFQITGYTAASGKFVYGNTVRMLLGSTSMYIPLSTAEASFTTAYPIVSTSVTGIRSNAIFVPDATRTNYAFCIGNRVTEKDVTMAASADQNFDPMQINLNVIGAAPTGTSTLNGIYQNITHDTTDMPNLRLKGCDWTITTNKQCMDAYVVQTELVVSGDKTSGGELMAMSALTTLGAGARTADRVLAFQAMITGDGTAGTVVGDCFVAYFVNAGTVITTSSIINVRNQSAATATSAVELELDGTVTYAIDFQGTVSDGWTSGDGAISGSTDEYALIPVRVAGITPTLYILAAEAWS